MSHRASHSSARFRAPAADLSTSSHLLVASHPVAIARALFADFSTHTAGMSMMRRSPKHEIGAHGTNLSTVSQQSHVRLLGVHSTFLKAVLNCADADLMTSGAVIDAVPHLIGYVRHCKLRTVSSGRGFSQAALKTPANRFSQQIERRGGSVCGGWRTEVHREKGPLKITDPRAANEEHSQ